MKDTKNSQYGSMWITDDTKNKKIKKNETIPSGWRKGRVNVHTEESIKKIRENMDSNPEKRKETMLKRYGTFYTPGRKAGSEKYFKEQHESKVNLNFDEKSIRYKRLQIIEEQQHKCLWCRNNEWNGKPLTLELDHIDGDTSNNNRENLRFLCPNCHSQTSTWRKSWKSHRSAADQTS